MRAVGVRGGKGGNADALYIDDNIPEPIVKSNDILVRIKGFGLNRMDIMQREAKYPYPPLTRIRPNYGRRVQWNCRRKGFRMYGNDIF